MCELDLLQQQQGPGQEGGADPAAGEPTGADEREHREGAAAGGEGRDDGQEDAEAGHDSRVDPQERIFGGRQASKVKNQAFWAKHRVKIMGGALLAMAAVACIFLL